MLAAWWLGWKYQDVFISDWDGYDYSVYVVRGWPSTLGLGRTLFLGYNILLWKIAQHGFGVQPEHSYLVLRYAVIAQSGPAILGVYALCKELTSGKLAALFGSALVAASPYYIIYSGRGMSEIPAVLLFSWSLWWMLRSLRLGRMDGFLIASYLAGLSANIREFSLFYLPFIVLAPRLYGHGWKSGLNALTLAVFGAFSGVLFWTLYEPDLYWTAVIKWYSLSLHERTIHPVTANNLLFLADFAYNCSCAMAIIAPLAFAWLWWKKELRASFLLACFGLLADIALLANHDLSVNPRYLLTGLIGLAPACGWALAEIVTRFHLRAMPLIFGLIVLTKGTYNHMAGKLYEQQWYARASMNYITKLDGLPWHSAFIVGSHSPLVNFYAGVGAMPHWRTISPGAGWPDDKIDQAIDDLMLAGRPVYVDFDPELWQTGLRAKNREEAGLQIIKRDYELELIGNSLYRIVKRLP